MAVPSDRPRSPTKISKRTGLLAWLILSLFTVALAGPGCLNLRAGELKVGDTTIGVPAVPQSGANVVEVFNEMHYQPSYKSQEGPRLLPPPDSVPVTGKELTYTTLDEYRELTVPAEVREAYDAGRAGASFGLNCAVCHGKTLRGSEEEDPAEKAKILEFMTKGPFPADLTASITRESTDGELFGFISRGGRQGLASSQRGRESGSPMPEFLRLLTEEERWALVLYLRSQ